MMDEDFIERTLRERRSLPDALAEILAKYSRIPPGIERTMLERMIAVLKDEIELRQIPPSPPTSAAQALAHSLIFPSQH
jgi:hypothetical protein